MIILLVFARKLMYLMSKRVQEACRSTHAIFTNCENFGETAISTPTAELGAPVLEEGHREDDERILHPLRVEHPMVRRTAEEDRAGSG